MGIVLPGPVADFLGFIGINWPNVDEDKVREFGQHISQFATTLQQTHTEANDRLSQLKSSYQGAGYEALLAKWGQMSNTHMTELVDGCHIVSTAMDVGADVIVGEKLAAIAQLGVMAAEFIADQAAAAATFGIAEAGVALIELQGRELVKFLEQELTNYVEGKIIDAAVGPLVSKVEGAVEGMVFKGVEGALGVSGVSPGPAVTIEPSAVIGFAGMVKQQGDAFHSAAQAFSSSASSMDFE